MTSPCLTPRVEHDSHATSKAGLTSDSEGSYLADQSLNSQATSKAGLFMGSDQDLTDFGGGSSLKKIVPEENSSHSSSSDSSPKKSDNNLSTEKSYELPCNTRSVNNRAMKAQLKEKDA